ncbi:MAG: Na+/H+ antiporter subunit E [Armatimonadota bacterium]|nr:Na+/H+ antiporter subunit E [Armatimonadota bacterium]MDR5696594.1 Na+/H+ antiporter subunit E [Armatimonadota bacterium]
MRRVWAFARLVLTVTVQMIRANLIMAAIILNPRRRIRPGLIRLPLEVRTDLAITTLANIITLIPGTMTVDLTADRRALIVHVFDLPDADAEVRTIKRNLEAVVREVFE